MLGSRDVRLLVVHGAWDVLQGEQAAARVGMVVVRAAGKVANLTRVAVLIVC
jgi:hypothetical protein